MALPLNLDQFSITIANGTALSPAIMLGADTLMAISMPAAWTAAGLSFQASVDGGATWQELVDDSGAAISFTVAANTFVMVRSQTNWFGINALKIRSGTSGAPVNQGADRVLTLVGRPINY